MLNKWSINVHTGLGLLNIVEDETFINNFFALSLFYFSFSV